MGIARANGCEPASSTSGSNRQAWRIVLTLLLWLGAIEAAPAAWRVIDADIVLRMALDGSILVRETFTIDADTSYRTPWRDLPLRTTQQGDAVIDVEVLQVTRAGQTLPWRATHATDALRIHLGSPRRRIPAGKRVYELLYHADGQLAVDGDREFLLWRPLGGGMAAPVSRLTVTVTFPRAIDPGAVDVRVAGGAPMTHAIARDGSVSLVARGPIEAEIGPAILVGWPRGHLLTESDSELAPWMRPRITSLWWGVTGALALVAIAWLAGRRVSSMRRPVAVAAATISLLALYAAGAPATTAPETFPGEFTLAVSCAACAWLARHWLGGGNLRIVYIILVTALAATVTVRWTLTISPWFPLLCIAHGDLFVLACRRARATPRGAERSAAAEESAIRLHAVPLLDVDDLLEDDTVAGQLPDGRRAPYFDTSGGRAPRPLRGSADGVSPPPAAGRRRPDASALRRGRARRY